MKMIDTLDSYMAWLFFRHNKVASSAVVVSKSHSVRSNPIQDICIVLTCSLIPCCQC